MNTKTNTHACSAIAGVLTLAAAAAAQPTIGTQIQVNNDGTFSPQNETTASSTDFAPNRVLMGWNDYSLGGGAKTGIGLSTDGGQNWATQILRPAPPFRSSTEGDPMTAFDNRNGRMWAGAISFDFNGGLFVSRLEPDSTSFGPVVMAALNTNSPSGFIDKCWMAAGPDALDPGNDSKTMLYVAYNDGLIRSSDLGDSWTNPVSLGGGLGFLPRVGNNGELFVLYWDFNFGINIWRSFDNGATLQGPFTVATRMDAWAFETDRVPGDFRVVPLAHLAIDPNDGTLYVVYFDTTNIQGGNRNLDLYFTKSTNNGTTWTTPTIISQDAPGFPSDSFFPWLECDQNGRLHMVYHDTRDAGPQSDFASPGRMDAYYSTSDDGGDTWTETRLSPSTFSSGDDGFGDAFMGDYHGLAVGGNFAYPSYVSTQNFNADVMTHIIETSVCLPDLADPEGVLDFSDVVAFLGAFAAMDPAADFAEPAGVFDFSDVVAFLGAFAAGCP